jgi:hypothetical protein
MGVGKTGMHLEEAAPAPKASSVAALLRAAVNGTGTLDCARPVAVKMKRLARQQWDGKKSGQGEVSKKGKGDDQEDIVIPPMCLCPRLSRCQFRWSRQHS